MSHPNFETSGFEKGVTEIFVTQVNPEKEQEFKAWLTKVQSIEAKFSGFNP